MAEGKTPNGSREETERMRGIKALERRNGQGKKML